MFCYKRNIWGLPQIPNDISVFSAVLTEVPVALSCICTPHAHHGISLHRCFAHKNMEFL